jgi:hypothetical protein
MIWVKCSRPATEGLVNSSRILDNWSDEEYLAYSGCKSDVT